MSGISISIVVVDKDYNKTDLLSKILQERNVKELPDSSIEFNAVYEDRFFYTYHIEFCNDVKYNDCYPENNWDEILNKIQNPEHLIELTCLSRNEISTKYLLELLEL